MINKFKYSIIVFLIILILTYYFKPEVFNSGSNCMLSSYIIIVAIVSFYLTILFDNYFSR